MPALLFRLRQVPDDEADDVRELLGQHAIEFYETSAGNWGISMPALWVHNDDDLHRAQQLIADYQETRQQQARADAKARREAGELPTLFDSLRRRPALSLLAVLFCLFILYVSLKPIMQLLEGAA